jgi:TRAP-type C4-dicarboxylate transport system permease small subunit
MRRSNILFVAAILILGWFGAEAYAGQNICVTSCISLSGLSSWEIGLVVAIIPVLLVIFGIISRRSPNDIMTEQQTNSGKSRSQSHDEEEEEE